MIGRVIGRRHHMILDRPDPAALASFYSALLGMPVTFAEDDFADVAADDTSSGLGFQLAPDHVSPRWRDPEHPQQIHLDGMVDDVESARPLVLALGASLLSDEDNVCADPAGHPFCLIPRPAWAPPIG